MKYLCQPGFYFMKQIRSTKLSFLLIAFAVLTVAGCSSSNNPSPNKPAKLLLVSFDGFRYDYLSKTETPHFDEFIRQGVMSEGLIPVVPSKTFPNHYTIATGLYPENSGLVGNTMYDPKWDEWYRIRDREAVENGEWYQGEPIWNTAEKQGLTTGTMFWVGSEADIQEMYPTYWKKFDGDMNERARIDTVVSWFTQDETLIDFGTLYFEHVDSQGQWHGTDSDSLVAAVQKADQLLGYLKQRLKQEQLWDKMNVMVVSDHGMADLSSSKVIVLDSIINMDHVKHYTLGPVSMIQPDSSHKDQIYQKLMQASRHYTVYKKENLPERYHLKNNRRVMDIVIVAEMPYTILLRENKQRFLNSLPEAAHGYDKRNPQMHALFAARGPAFVSGDTVSSFQNIHLYELMSHLLGLDPAPNDGALDSVKVLLK